MSTGGPADTIGCVECGGVCHLQSYEPEDGFEPGDVIAYVCAECNHRFDVVVSDEDFDDGSDPW